MNDPVMIQKMKNYVKEMEGVYQRRADSTSFTRDLMDAAKADGFNPKDIRRLAKLSFEQNAEEVKADNDELFEKYDTLGL